VLNASFRVGNTVMNNLKVATAPPGGEGSTAGKEVEITITFISPIILPAGQYFFRPEVLLAKGGFPLLVCAETDSGAPRSADLDPRLQLGPELAANRHGHRRGSNATYVQYDLFPRW